MMHRLPLLPPPLLHRRPRAAPTSRHRSRLLVESKARARICCVTLARSSCLLPKLLPPAPSVSALASIHKKRVQFSIHDLLDIEGDTDDATFFADLKEYVGSLPSEEQSTYHALLVLSVSLSLTLFYWSLVRYLDLASDEVKENMICAGQYIANYARFRAGEPFRVTLLVIGEAGIGKRYTHKHHALVWRDSLCNY